MNEIRQIRQICAGRHFPDVSRLDWLSALLSQYKHFVTEFPLEIDDEEAEIIMLDEVQGLLTDLRTAVRQVER